MKSNFSRRSLITIIMAVCLCFAFSSNALAAYSVGFSTNDIQIIEPPNDGTEVHGTLPISGTAEVEEVWFCVRGPQNEVEAQYTTVTDGKFSIEIALRFGPGKYTIWADDNKTNFDGKIRFTAYNIVEDNRYTSSSTYVDSDNNEIIELSKSLVNDDMTDIEKAKAIHDWVAGNIKYDYQAYLEGDLGLKTASATLKDGAGVCSGYSFLFAALCRAADLPAKVVYGQINGGDGWEDQKHAWNEVQIEGEWITIDNTWDAGYIKNGSFVAALSDEYFDSDPATFALSHTGKEDKLY
ncbi:MAG TPA: transglutaminase domain-containing protein [Syntrophomonadaceae bacterium]|nr:transglutaminase domain-containing protein [Syntrophomonadaceae bacterium]HPR94067.1 transglutaminase domain-containing protein [Syntrophomonadaceae bacterium]